MALDFISILANGSHVTPIVGTTERAIRAESQGLLGTAPLVTTPDGEESSGLNDVGTSTTL